jgi:hypothetical protein
MRALNYTDVMLKPPQGEKSWTRIVRLGFENACKEFTKSVEPLGFSRTRKTIWGRRREHTIEFIHFHRAGSSYGAPFNASVTIHVSFGIRVLNDDFSAPIENGPTSDPMRLRSGLYHLRFNAHTGSTFERCMFDLIRFVKEQGEPWFSRFQTIENLLGLPDSPLRPSEKELLRKAAWGESDPAKVAYSLKLFGFEAEN